MPVCIDNLAFERIVDEHQAKLRAYARRIARNREDAEEIVQDAFLRAYGALGRMSDEQSRSLRLKPWLYTITLNVARNYLRKKPPAPVSLNSSEGVERLLAQRLVDRETPETALDQRASLREVEEMLCVLPEHLRAAAYMRFVDDRTHSQIASSFQQPIGTVKSHLHRATNIMRRVFAVAA